MPEPINPLSIGQPLRFAIEARIEDAWANGWSDLSIASSPGEDTDWWGALEFTREDYEGLLEPGYYILHVNNLGQRVLYGPATTGQVDTLFAELERQWNDQV